MSVHRYAHMIVGEDPDFTIAPAKLTIYQYKDLSGSFWKLPCQSFNQTSEFDSSSSIDETSTSSDSSDSFSISSLYLVTGETSYVESLFNSVAAEELDDEFDSGDLSGDFSIIETTYDLTLTDPLGPLNLTLSSCQLQSLFYSIQEMKIAFTYRAANVGLAIVPYFWDIELHLKLIGGQVQPTIVITHRITNIIGLSSGDLFSILNVLLLLLALLSGTLATKFSIQSINIFIRTKKRYKYLQCAARPGDHVSIFI